MTLPTSILDAARAVIPTNWPHDQITIIASADGTPVARLSPDNCAEFGDDVYRIGFSRAKGGWEVDAYRLPGDTTIYPVGTLPPPPPSEGDRRFSVTVDGDTVLIRSDFFEGGRWWMGPTLDVPRGQVRDVIEQLEKAVTT